MMRLLRPPLAALAAVGSYLAVALAARDLPEGPIQDLLPPTLLFAAWWAVVDVRSDAHNLRHAVSGHGGPLFGWWLGQTLLFLGLPVVLNVLPGWEALQRRYWEWLAGQPPWALALRALVAAPLVEEILFRGLYGRLAGVPTAAFRLWFLAVGALAFAAIHRPAQWPSAAFNGAAYLALYVRFDSLCLVILMHALTNAVGMGIVEMRRALPATVAPPLWLGVAWCVLGLVLLWICRCIMDFESSSR